MFDRESLREYLLFLFMRLMHSIHRYWHCTYWLQTVRIKHVKRKRKDAKYVLVLNQTLIFLILMLVGMYARKKGMDVQDVRTVVYPGVRHEIHNEPGQTEVFSDIADRLDAWRTEHA